MGVLEDLGTHLQTEGVATVGTDLFYNYMPDTPDVAVNLVKSGVTSPEEGEVFGGDTLPVFERTSVICVVRTAARDSSAAETLSDSIWQTLHLIANETVNGTYYLRVVKVDGPEFVGTDTSDRPMYETDFEILKYI